MQRMLGRRVAAGLVVGTFLVAMLPAAAAAQVGTATQLVFGSTVATAEAGTVLSTITVRVEDAEGNLVTTSTAGVTLAIGTNPGGGTLGGTTTIDASGGIAMFSDLSIDKAGIGYTLVASSSGLTGSTSGAFTIAGPPAQVVFGVQPSSVAVLATISPAVTVQVEDANGIVVPTDASLVTLSLTPGMSTVGATLGGTLQQQALNGVATFPDLTVNEAGSGYTLTASDGSLAPAISAGFTTGGSADQLLFGVQPSAAATNAVISPAVTVMVVNASGGGLVNTSGEPVTISLGTNPGGGTLSGTTTQLVVNGVATFPDLSINEPGSGYTLVASSPGFDSGGSTAFTIGVGSEQLLFSQQPSAAGTNAVISPAITVLVVDTFGSLVNTSGEAVTISLGTNPGGGTLSGTTTEFAVNGVATFPDLSINEPGSGYTLVASSPGFNSAVSVAFTVGAGSEQLVFTTQPGGGNAGAAWATQPVVAVEDVYGNLLTSDDSTVVSLGISSNPAGGTLTCSSGTSMTVTNGIASFSGCAIDLASGAQYTLLASASPAWTPATSAPFTIGSMLTPVTLTDEIAAGVDRGTSGFGTSSRVVPAHGYITLLVETSPNLAGSAVQIWSESKTEGWHLVTDRLVASDGTVHYFARDTGWTAWRAIFAGDATHASADGHGRIATNPA